MDAPKPDGFNEFDKLARKLVQVPPSELPALDTEMCERCDGTGFVDDGECEGVTCPKCDGGLVPKEK